MNRRHILAFWLFTSFFSAALPAKAQILNVNRRLYLSERPLCSEEGSDPDSAARSARLSFISYLRTAGECGASERALSGI